MGPFGVMLRASSGRPSYTTGHDQRRSERHRLNRTGVPPDLETGRSLLAAWPTNNRVTMYLMDAAHENDADPG
jgi:hypothetical protein